MMYTLNGVIASYELSEKRREQLLSIGAIELEPQSSTQYRIARGRTISTDDLEYAMDSYGDEDVGEKDQRPHYSCCFVRQGMHVLLVRKNHPDWQNGRLNGVGGRARMFETPLECAQREWTEETSLPVPSDLAEFLVLEDREVVVHMFSGTSIDNVAGMPRENDVGERLLWGSLSDARADWLDPFLAVDNLVWLIPMAFRDRYHVGGRVRAMRRVSGDGGKSWQPDLSS